MSTVSQVELDEKRFSNIQKTGISIGSRSILGASKTLEHKSKSFNRKFSQPTPSFEELKGRMRKLKSPMDMRERGPSPKDLQENVMRLIN